MKLIDSYAETTDDNATFGKHLKRWLDQHQVDVEDARGVIMVVLLEDGFDLLQLGPRAMDDAELRECLIWIGRRLEEQLT